MLDVREIMKRIPQRLPLFLVDKVSELSASSVVGYKNVTMDEPHFRGHFPGNPLMPGVLQLEALLQITWLLYVGNEFREKTWQKVDLVGVKKFRFRQPVRPGDRLDLQAKELSCQDDLAVVAVKALVDGNISCEGTLTLRLL